MSPCILKYLFPLLFLLKLLKSIIWTLAWHLYLNPKADSFCIPSSRHCTALALRDTLHFFMVLIHFPFYLWVSAGTGRILWWSHPEKPWECLCRFRVVWEVMSPAQGRAGALGSSAASFTVLSLPPAGLWQEPSCGHADERKQTHVLSVTFISCWRDKTGGLGLFTPPVNLRLSCFISEV